MTNRPNIGGYRLEVYEDPEDGAWVAEVPDLPGAMAAGETPTEAISGVEDAIGAWIDAAHDDGRQVPAPRPVDDQFSGRFVVRVPRSLHRRLVTEARRDGVSLNTYCVNALAQAVGIADAQAVARSTFAFQYRDLWPHGASSTAGIIRISEKPIGYGASTEEQMVVPTNLLVAYATQGG